jgi:hypothetical protein
MREVWEFRINGIRSGGDTFANYRDATEQVFRTLNQLHYTHANDRDHNGKLEGQAIAEISKARRQLPRPNLQFHAKREGAPWILQVNRIPW